MENFLTAIGIPLLLLIIGLVIEYWIIQPVKNAREFSTLPSQERRNWSTATTKALRKFKSQLPQHNGILRRKTFWIEEQEVKRGHSVVKVSISQARYLWENLLKSPVVSEQYEMIIDRTGDILATKPLPIKKENTEKNADKSSNAVQKTQIHPTPYAAYLYIVVGLLGGSGGLSSSIILDYSTTTTSSNAETAPLFYMVAILAGIVLAIATDIYFRMDQAFAWQRLPLALIAGFIGGWVGILIVCATMFLVLGLIFYVFIARQKS